MDQAQARALAALQPFVHLAVTTKSPSHRFLADLINRATAAQGTYIFTELLQTPAIQSLRAADTPAEFRAYLTQLEIFSYGTYEEYNNTPDLPPLNDAQATKLRQVSLLSLAANPIPLIYTNLLSALSLPSASSLESLITSAIYANLLTARLSPTSKPPVVHITSVAPLRDLRPLSMPALISVLSVWSSRCDSVISMLSGNIENIKSEASRRKSLATERQDVVDTAVLASNTSDSLGGDSKPNPRSRPSKVTTGGNNLKRDLDEQQEDDMYEDQVEDISAGDDVVNGGGMDLDEPVQSTSGSGSAKFSAGGGVRGNKKSRGKLHL